MRFSTSARLTPAVTEIVITLCCFCLNIVADSQLQHPAHQFSIKKEIFFEKKKWKKKIFEKSFFNRLYNKAYWYAVELSSMRCPIKMLQISLYVIISFRGPGFPSTRGPAPGFWGWRWITSFFSIYSAEQNLSFINFPACRENVKIITPAFSFEFHN